MGNFQEGYAIWHVKNNEGFFKNDFDNVKYNGRHKFEMSQ